MSEGALLDTPLAALFWLLSACTLYVYVGYPLLLAAWTRLGARPWRQSADAALPGVSVVIAVRNEAANIAARIRNLRDLEYPVERLEILFVSDGSTDGTDAAIAAHPDVRLISLPAGGKAVALNAGVAAATHPIVLFGDARQRFASDAARRLVGNFADPTVGGVSGELVLDCEASTHARGGAVPAEPPSAMADGMGLYWRYEKWLRRHESQVGSTLGATGAIYALRRELWRPLPPGTILDDVLAPMRIVLAGKRIVFDETARAFDAVSPDAATEHRRKRRTLAGVYQLLGLEWRLLLPIVNPVWFQFVSHKIGRLLVPWMLLGMLVSSAVLSTRSRIFAALLAAQLGFYLLALYGAWLEARGHRVRKATARRHGYQPGTSRHIA